MGGTPGRTGGAACGVNHVTVARGFFAFVFPGFYVDGTGGGVNFATHGPGTVSGAPATAGRGQEPPSGGAGAAADVEAARTERDSPRLSLLGGVRVTGVT